MTLLEGATSASGTGSLVAADHRRPGHRGWFRVAIVVTGLVAFVVRLAIARRGGGIGGTFGYDDGVYYASAASLVLGRLPYRDFVLVHPPGMMLALTPFALLGRWTQDHVGLETARVAWMALGALNATFVVRICRRAGLGAATAGGLFYALWTPVALTETTLRLEPLVTCGLLLAVVLLARRGRGPTPRLLALAGAALALAVSTKIWAAAPVLLVLWWVWRRHGGRALGWSLAGAVGTGVLVDGPFFLAAPTSMFRMVVHDQLGRGRSVIDAPARLAHTLLPVTTLSPQWVPSDTTVACIALVAGIVTVACLSSGLGRFALSLLVVQLVVLLLSPSFFSYYNAFAGPGIALTFASVVSWLSAPVHRAWSRRRRAWSGTAAVLLALLVGSVMRPGLTADSQVVASQVFPAAPLGRIASAYRCVTSDSPDALELTDLFTRNLQRGCEVPVDLSGLTYDVDALPLRADGTSVSRSLNPGWQHDLRTYLLSGQVSFLLRPSADGLRGYAVRDLEALPRLARGSAYALISTGTHAREVHESHES